MMVSGWYGRLSGDPRTITCARNGWREAIWERDQDDRWQEVSATLRPVIAIDRIGNVTLGEPMVI